MAESMEDVTAADDAVADDTAAELAMDTEGVAAADDDDVGPAADPAAYGYAMDEDGEAVMADGTAEEADLAADGADDADADDDESARQDLLTQLAAADAENDEDLRTGGGTSLPAAEDKDEEDDVPPPAKPKRAMAAWNFYLADKHGNRLSKEASEAWKAMGDEAKAEYVAKAAADKARYEIDKEEYKLRQAAWEAAHPIAASAQVSDKNVLEPTVSYLPLATVRRIAKFTGESKAVSKDALFAISKATEQMLAMVSGQTVICARKAKRKSINTADLAAVLYGPRLADLMQFCHEDMPQEELIALAQPKKLGKGVAAPVFGKTVKKIFDAADAEGGARDGETAESGEAGADAEGGDVPVGVASTSSAAPRFIDATIDRDDTENEGLPTATRKAKAKSAKGAVPKAVAKVGAKAKEGKANEPKESGKAKGGTKKAEKEAPPVQSTTMKSFFEARPRGEPAPPPPADAAPAEGSVRRPRKLLRKMRLQDDDEENEEGEGVRGEGDEIEDDEDDEGGAGRAGRMAEDSDEERVQGDDELEPDEEDEEDDASMQVSQRPNARLPRRRNVLIEEDDDDEDEDEDEKGPNHEPLEPNVPLTPEHYAGEDDD
jgi:histone H3/H4